MKLPAAIRLPPIVAAAAITPLDLDIFAMPLSQNGRIVFAADQADTHAAILLHSYGFRVDAFIAILAPFFANILPFFSRCLPPPRRLSYFSLLQIRDAAIITILLCHTPIYFAITRLSAARRCCFAMLCYYAIAVTHTIRAFHYFVTRYFRFSFSKASFDAAAVSTYAYAAGYLFFFRRAMMPP